MLNQILIFTRTGLVLLHSTIFEGLGSLGVKELADFVIGRAILNENEVGSTRDFRVQKHGIYWSEDNEDGLIFVIVIRMNMNSDAIQIQKTLDLVSGTFSMEYKLGRRDYASFSERIKQTLESDSLLSSKCAGYPESKSRSSIHRDVVASLPESDEVKDLSIFLQKSPSRMNAHMHSRSLETIKVLSQTDWIKSILTYNQSRIDEQSLKPFAALLKQKLLSKNVSLEISDLLVNKVLQKLIGRKIGSLESIASVVHTSFEQAVVNIFTTPSEIDILSDIKVVTSSRRPYVITVVGVNGVGKSTSLSKLVHWFIQQKFSVLIAACDTFRAGAVEQLRTHSRRLGCTLYERGYEKDPATIAQQAIQQAKRQGIDIVMIDTAGRMQANEPLMRALAKLVSVNTPDLTLFVGEALVGNDGVSQVLQFEKRLQDLAHGNQAKVISGIFLSKFDTIDDKVGAALSLVCSSSIPIMFVGVGQNYEDICKFKPEAIASLLLR